MCTGTAPMDKKPFKPSFNTWTTHTHVWLPWWTMKTIVRGAEERERITNEYRQNNNTAYQSIPG